MNIPPGVILAWTSQRTTLSPVHLAIGHLNHWVPAHSADATVWKPLDYKQVLKFAVSHGIFPLAHNPGHWGCPPAGLDGVGAGDGAGEGQSGGVGEGDGEDGRKGVRKGESEGRPHEARRGWSAVGPTMLGPAEARQGALRARGVLVFPCTCTTD